MAHRHRHRDAFGRVSFVEERDAFREHYLNPKDGRLTEVVVQGAAVGNKEEDDDYDEDGILMDDVGSNWTRISPPERNILVIMALVYWAYSSVLIEGTEKRRWNWLSTMKVVAKWIPTCLVLALMVSFGAALTSDVCHRLGWVSTDPLDKLLIPQEIEGEYRNGGRFDPVHYRDWGYQKIPLNRSEALSESVPRMDRGVEESEALLDGNEMEMSELAPHGHPEPVSDAGDSFSGEIDENDLRGFGPRYLCFLRNGSDGDIAGYDTWKVSDWLQAHGGQGEADTDYVFISYTRKQFCVDTEADLLRRGISDDLRPAYAQLSSVNRDALVRYGERAARSTGKRAFWIDFECIRDIQGISEASSQSHDVYRICDIVRASSSMAIVVGPPIETQLPGGTPQPYNNGVVTAWLQQWGTRLWTLPEVLLCPSEHRIKLYPVGSVLPPEEIAKRNFAARAALPDANIVRQLTDHYESSIHLSPLELISLALQCFSIRETNQSSQGDIAYALMGLLRRRPPVNRKDTDFEAFARLSLANNSDKLLERMLCIRTERLDAAWHDTKDAWGMSLWDIEPHCQVAGIIDDQTVSLDGAYGASIRWDSMGQVGFLKRPTGTRTFAKIALRGVPLYFIGGLIFTSVAAVMKSDADRSADDDSENSLGNSDSANWQLNALSSYLFYFGVTWLIVSLAIIFTSPLLLFTVYQGKFWSSQALFIGVEGIPKSLGSLERNLFGFDHGRLKWSVAGSSLSRHFLSSCGECVALPPRKDDCKQDGARTFTLVDTYTMVATAFRAVRPPTAVMVCGQEGGMQRAILCSYDWKHVTFSREAVVRMRTTVLDRMSRVNRFRFALRRRTNAATGADSMIPADEESSRSLSQHYSWKETRFWFWANRTVDVALIPCMWLVYGTVFFQFVETSYSHTVIRGTVTSASALIMQIVNYKALFSFRVGYYLGVAVLIKGIAGLVISVMLIKNPEESNFGGEIVLQSLLATTDAIIGPCFVLLTAAWYANTNGGCIVRLLLWASSYPILISTINYIADAARASGTIYYIIYAYLAVICILASNYIFAHVGMPGVTMWLDRAHRQVRLRGRERWQRHRRSLPVAKLIAQPTTWFVFGATFFNAASTPLGSEVFPHFYEFILKQQAQATFLSLLPVPAFGFLVVKYPVTCVPILVLTASLAFAGRILVVNNPHIEHDFGSPYFMGVILLQNMTFYWPYLLWATLFLISSGNDAVDSRDLVANIVVAFAGNALGLVVGYGVLPPLTAAGDEWFESVRVAPTKVFMTIMFALQILDLLAWFGWLVRQRLREGRQKGGGEQPTPAGPNSPSEPEC